MLKFAYKLNSVQENTTQQFDKNRNLVLHKVRQILSFGFGDCIFAILRLRGQV